MRVIKLYRKPDTPEYFKLVKVDGGEMLLDYPIDVPNWKRLCRWVKPEEVYIDWIKTFEGE